MPIQNSINTESVFPASTSLLPGATFIPNFTSNISTGTTTLYTVPSGKKAVIIGSTGWNSSAGNIVAYWVAGIAGVDHRVSADATIVTLTQHTTVPQAPILNAGDTIKIVTTTNNGLNEWLKIIEFSENSSLKRVSLEAPASGDNTLYTVPSGKKAVLITNATGFSPLGVTAFSNESGGSINIYYNLVPSGGSVATSNRISALIAASNNALNLSGNMSATMAAGDFINANLSSAGTSSLLWINVNELDA